MRNSLTIIFFFALGILTAHYKLLPKFVLNNDLSVYALYLLLILVGLLVGMDENSINLIKSAPYKLLIVPFATMFGTYLGIIVAKLFIKQFSLTDLLAVGSGFGYYSLSSILLAKIKSQTLGTLALLSNILRELTTLLFTPIFVKIFGPFGPILSGGATSMDTTLPIITEYSGKQYVLISVFNGLILSLSVPFLVALFCAL